MATKIIDAIGNDNFVEIDNCISINRLRLVVNDTTHVNLGKIKSAGAFGNIILGKKALQIVVGTGVEHVANAMKKQLKMQIPKNDKIKINKK